MPKRIGLRVEENEYTIIKKNADSAGLGLSAFLREVGQGIIPQSRYDHTAVKDLLKVSAELAKLGNLLKMALNNENIWREQQETENILTLHKELDIIKSKLLEKVENLC